ncbi:MAG: co-chaperone GroES [Bdellovibrionales bacterium]|nr:co-chaperone GroES [Bdellovibrionales bacterium]
MKSKKGQELVRSEEFLSATQRTTMKRINPLGMRVVVRIREVEGMTEGGLYLPETAKKQMSESLLAEVLEVASAHDSETDEETNISGIPMGALVLIGKNVGTAIPWDQALRIVDTKDILGIVDEVEVV